MIRADLNTEPFSFWRSTVRTYPESDPGDLASNGQEYSDFRGAVSYAGRTVLLGGRRHWILRAEPTLAPSTVSLVPFIEFEAYPEVTPAYALNAVLVPYATGNYSGFRRLVPSPEDADQLLAPSVTTEIPFYIAGRPVQCESSSATGMVFVRAEVEGADASSVVYVYSYTQVGTDLVQSAWHKWIFDGQVKHLISTDSEVYFVIQDDGGTRLTKLLLDDVFATEGSLEWRLDDRLTASDLVINEAGGKTTFTAPAGIEFDQDREWLLVYTKQSNAPGTYTDSDKIPPFAAAASASSVNIAGNMRQYADFYVASGFYIANLFKAARDWQFEPKNQPALGANASVATLYPSGNPAFSYPNLSGAPTSRAFTILFKDLDSNYTGAVIPPTFRAGEYVITYTGTGDFIVGYQAVANNLITPNPYNSGAPGLAGETAPGSKRIEFTVTNPTNAGVYISIYQSNPGDPVKNIEVFFKADESIKTANPWYAPLVNDFKERFRFNYLRPMEFRNDNKSYAIKTASNIVTNADCFWTTGFSIEALCKLCNAVGAGLWYNAPPFADSSFLQAEATLIKNTLTSSLDVRVAGPNEMWNTNFYETGAGSGLWVDGTSTAPASFAWKFTHDPQPAGSGLFTLGGPAAATLVDGNLTGGPYEQVYKAMGRLSKRAHDAFAAVFTGGDAARLTFVHETQAASGGANLAQLALPLAPLTESLAIAPYINGNPFIDFSHPTYALGAAQVHITAGLAASKTWITTHQTFLDAYNGIAATNITLDMYEMNIQAVPGKYFSGGVSELFYPTGGFWSNDSNLPVPGNFYDPANKPMFDTFKAFYQAPFHRTLMEDLLAFWNTTTNGGVVCFYADYARVWPTDGMYGLLEYPGQAASSWPKAQMLIDFVRGGGGGGVGPGVGDPLNDAITDLGGGTFIPGPPVAPGTTVELTWVSPTQLRAQGLVAEYADYLQIGATFPSYLTLSPPMFRRGDSSAVLAGQPLMKAVKVYFEDLYHLQVRVAAENGKTYTQEVTGKVTPSKLVTETGSKEFPALGRPDKVAVTLANDSVHPSWLGAVDFLLTYAPR
jgi:hypothetical protein